MEELTKPFSWIVKRYDCNRNVICDYDVLKYREDDIKQFKKKCKTIGDFAEKMRSEIQYHYWSKAEWEVIISVDEYGNIFLSPWCGCRNPDEVKLEVTDDLESFGWKGFAELHGVLPGKPQKIDVYDQIDYYFEKFIDYCWNYRHKWSRKK